MKDLEVDMALAEAVRTDRGVPPEVLGRVTTAIQSSLLPVRPAPRTWVLTVGLLLLCAIVALVGAARAGFGGFQAQDAWERVVNFATLACLIGIVSRELVSQWTPGGRHLLSPGALIVLVTATLLGVFALLFTDYHATNFLSAGLVCLSVGVLHAIPAACLAAWFLRRGFAVEPLAAGAIAGAFGGLAGVSLLELHCANLEAPHVLLWHVAVVPVSAGLGALVGWASNAVRAR
jgi:hypothetical protein